jgi:hypothetical protein
MCPQPAATLRDYEHRKAHEYDRRCPTCGYYFLYSEGTIRATKDPTELQRTMKQVVKKYQDSEMILGKRTLYKNWRKGRKKKSSRYNVTKR